MVILDNLLLQVGLPFSSVKWGLFLRFGGVTTEVPGLWQDPTPLTSPSSPGHLPPTRNYECVRA